MVPQWVRITEVPKTEPQKYWEKTGKLSGWAGVKFSTGKQGRNQARPIVVLNPRAHEGEQRKKYASFSDFHEEHGTDKTKNDWLKMAIQLGDCTRFGFIFDANDCRLEKSDLDLLKGLETHRHEKMKGVRR